MDILIQEARFSSPVSYTIEAPQQTWNATKKAWSLHAHLTLQAGDDSVLARIDGESLIFNRFTISLASGSTYHYQVESGWKGVDRCDGPAGPFFLYAHKGNRYSVFQSEQQIAAIESDKMIVGNGRTFRLRLEPDSDRALLVAMVLCLNTENGDDKQQDAFTYDFGRIGPEDRKFDEAWRPSDEVV